ncbi:MAG TPA: hypothetical protein ENK18_25855 [Deltaproteobacteria bacterium]|nr:hypothetical protein [Deltaproteobacteria bacterium]
MSTFEGKLTYEDLGTGAWVLETSDGERITLAGEIPRKLAGSKVRVQGRIVEGAMGFAMVGGRTVEVNSISNS